MCQDLGTDLILLIQLEFLNESKNEFFFYTIVNQFCDSVWGVNYSYPQKINKLIDSK